MSQSHTLRVSMCPCACVRVASPGRDGVAVGHRAGRVAGEGGACGAGAQRGVAGGDLAATGEHVVPLVGRLHRHDEVVAVGHHHVRHLEERRHVTPRGIHDTRWNNDRYIRHLISSSKRRLSVVGYIFFIKRKPNPKKR